MNKENEITKFYKLKAMYNKQNKIAKSKILNNPLLDISTKKTVWKSYKKKCVSCKKPVDTYFSTKNRRLIARCGALNASLKTTPCNLNIDVTLDKSIIASDLLNKQLQKKNELEQDMNLKKLDIVYNYEDEEKVLEDFEKTKRTYVKNNRTNLNSLKLIDKELKETEEEKNIQSVIDEYIKESKEISQADDIDYESLSAYNIDIKNNQKRLNQLKYKNYYISERENDVYMLVKKEKSIHNTTITI